MRTALESDTQRISEIAASAISPAWSLGDVRERLGREDSHLFVADDDSRIVGFAACRQIDDAGELLQLAVAVPTRRCGAGSLLLGAVIDYARKKALTSVFLEVRADNAPAIALYKKHGFEQVRIRKSYYDNPAGDAVVMARKMES